METPLLTASPCPPITSRPAGAPFLGRKNGKMVNRVGPGRGTWEGAGGNVGQDPGRVLLRFSRGEGESGGERDCARLHLAGGGTGAAEVLNTLRGTWRYQGS